MGDRSQPVQIDGGVSKSILLLCGLPQGSILGALVFSMYSEPIVTPPANMIKIHSSSDNTLQLNDGKAEVLVISTPFSLIGDMKLISELVMLVFKLVCQPVTLA